MMKKYICFTALALTLLMVACAPTGYKNHESGFFEGVWHGIIFVFSLELNLVTIGRFFFMVI